MSLKNPEVACAPNQICQQTCLFHIEHHHDPRILNRVRKRGPRLLVRGLPVNDHCIISRPELRAALPHLFHKWTGGIVLIRVDAPPVQLGLNFHCRTKCGHHHDVVGLEHVPRNELFPRRREHKSHPARLQIRIHLGVVNHLAEEKHAPIRARIQGLIRDFNGIFHAKTKPKMPRQQKPHRPKIQHGRLQIALFGVRQLPRPFHAGNDLALVKDWNIKFSGHGIFQK